MIAGGLPRSCYRIIEALAACDKEVMQSEIIAISGIPKRTVKYALKRLIEEGFVSKAINLNDTRRAFYLLDKRCPK